MSPAEHISASPTSSLAPPGGLRTWLILLSIAALLCVGLAVIFGLLINMDTKIEMNPNGDPLARQDAIGLRLFGWAGVSLFILLQIVGIAGGWIAYRRGRSRLSIGLSFVAVAPILLAIGIVLLFLGNGS